MGEKQEEKIQEKMKAVKIGRSSGNFFFQHAAGDPVFRSAVFCIGKVSGLNDFIHHTPFRYCKRKNILFIDFGCGDNPVFSDFIGMKG